MGSGAGLGLVTRYTYLDVLNHYQQGECQLLGCTPEAYECCNHCGTTKAPRTCCQTCYDYIIEVSMVINDTVYDKIVKYSQCNAPTTTCYYDDRQIYNTLALKPLPPPEGLIGIVILSVFIGFVLVGTLVTACFTGCVLLTPTSMPTPPPYGNDDL